MPSCPTYSIKLRRGPPPLLTLRRLQASLARRETNSRSGSNAMRSYSLPNKFEADASQCMGHLETNQHTCFSMSPGYCKLLRHRVEFADSSSFITSQPTRTMAQSVTRSRCRITGVPLPTAMRISSRATWSPLSVRPRMPIPNAVMRRQRGHKDPARAAPPPLPGLTLRRRR